MTTVHKTVLLQETIDSLQINPGDVVIDATVNAGGHSSEIARRFKDNVVIVGVDADSDALTRAQKTMQKYPDTHFVGVLSNFRYIRRVADNTHLPRVDRIIFDLGLSSDQLEVSGRGFSFKLDEPLLMTFSKDSNEKTLSAFDVVNKFEISNLEAIIRGFGEEKFAGRIAKAIGVAREKAPINTSKELAQVIKQSVPNFYRIGKIHPATKTFQAIRMTVNDEIGALEEGIRDGFSILSSGGRMAVITFHSIEDRIVKHFFRELVKDCKGKLVNKKPILPTREEIQQNSRSRSAKLRIIEKI